MKKRSKESDTFVDIMSTPLDDVETVRAQLIATAKQKKPVTYSELLGMLGYRFSRPKMRAICRTIGEVDRLARLNGEPELAVLVVRASDGLPGQGWWESQNHYEETNIYMSDPNAPEYVRACQGVVFEYWSRSRPP